MNRDTSSANGEGPDTRDPQYFSWDNDASCAMAISCSDFFLDLWFKEENTLQSSIASTICFRCPVRQECLQRACELRESEGIWGGLPPSIRLKRGQGHNYSKLVALPNPYDTTDEGSRFHLRNLIEGEPNE